MKDLNKLSDNLDNFNFENGYKQLLNKIQDPEFYDKIIKSVNTFDFLSNIEPIMTSINDQIKRNKSVINKRLGVYSKGLKETNEDKNYEKVLQVLLLQ